MTKLLTHFRFVTAILSLVAVVFAVMEHEDLLFQGSWAEQPSANSSNRGEVEAGDEARARVFNPAALLITTVQDSGTEGAFRQESHKVCTVPASPQTLAGAPFPAMLLSLPFARTVRRVALRSRLRRGGMVELRL
jgi:hypothetical protein